MILGQEYCGDKAMQEMLKKLGSPRTLHEVYGLFYGCITAPRLVRPSDYLDLILGKEEDRKPFESLEDANRMLGNIMSLWNLIAAWKPEEGEYIYPETEYPVTLDGLKRNIADDSAFIEYFVKGLGVGGLQEAHVKGDVSTAFEDLGTTAAIHEKLLDVLERDTTAKESDIAETRKQLAQLKDVMINCIARMNMGLREARIAEAHKMQEAMTPAPVVRGTKVGRDDPCPCGSGKKYKKCCAGSA